MDNGSASRATRVALIGVLVVAWLLAWLDYNASVARTGYTNVPDWVLLVGVVLCAYAGAITWALAPGHRRARFGALAGLAMLAS